MENLWWHKWILIIKILRNIWLKRRNNKKISKDRRFIPNIKIKSNNNDLTKIKCEIYEDTNQHIKSWKIIDKWMELHKLRRMERIMQKYKLIPNQYKNKLH